MNGIDDLLDQLMATLQFQDPLLREKLRKGLLRGMSEAAEGSSVEVSLDLEAPVDVVLLDGGGEGSEDAEPPHLEVFDGENEPLSKSEVEVHVFHAGGHATSDLKQGLVSIRDAVQVVYRGTTARCYRLHCDEGDLSIHLDGNVRAEIGRGQTIDVESSWIQVSGTGSARYLNV